MLVDFAWIIGVLSVVVSIAIIFFVFLFRKYTEAQVARKKSVYDQWLEILFEVVNSDDEAFDKQIRQYKKSKEFTVLKIDDDSLLTFSEKESPHLLHAWNYIHESLDGKAKERLNTFGRRHGLKFIAIEMLESRLITHKLMAINTLGNLGDKGTFGYVLNFAFKEDSIISTWAFRAMFRIRPSETIKHHLYMIAERNDWSPSHIAKIIHDCEVDMISSSLANVCRRSYEKNLSEKQLAYLVSYLRFAHDRDSSPLLKKILDESDETEVLISCLRLVKTTASVERIRELLKDQRWQVRMHAIIALERFRIVEDIKLLLVTLRDDNWWVRYYSAKALIQMPTMNLDRIKKLSVMVETAFERDILLQIWAETEFQWKTQLSTKL